MDCRTAEGMINQYIARTLSDRELELFLQHIETCSSCYDELETYFIVHEASRQLHQEEDDFSYDFKGLLEEDIRKTKVNLRKNRICTSIAYALCGLALTVILVSFVNVVIDLI